MIGIVGHADLTAGTLDRVERDLSTRLGNLAQTGLVGLVRVGAGVPLAFARAVRRAGLSLVVVMAAGGPLPSPLPEQDRRAAGELLVLASQLRMVPLDLGNRRDCVVADEKLVASCRRIVAVWDGVFSDHRDATAHLVAYARNRAIPVDVVWPPGAVRIGASRFGVTNRSSGRARGAEPHR